MEAVVTASWQQHAMNGEKGTVRLANRADTVPEAAACHGYILELSQNPT